VSSSITQDGRHVLAYALASDAAFSVVPVGVRRKRRVSTGGLVGLRADWLPGGNEVILSGSRPGEGRRLYRVQLETGSIRMLHDTILGTRHVAVSPDGTCVLARKEDDHLALFPIDGSPHRSYPKLDTGVRFAGWAGDSRSFFIFLPN